MMESEDFIAILDNKYKLFTQIGSGGTSKVYLGYKLSDQSKQKYAIKVFKKKYRENMHTNNEIEKLLELDNENIVKYYGHGKGNLCKKDIEPKLVTYIVLEYFINGDLFHYITVSNTGFGELIGANIFKQLLDAVQYLHNNCIVHRDIKPENIMIDDDFKIKLTDFGFASSLSKHRDGMLRTLVGTNGYCAPELLKEEPYYGIQNDIFSLGVTLFVIIFGRKPFSEASDSNLLYSKIINRDYDSFWEKVSGIKVNTSNELKELLNLMFSYDFTQRPTIDEIKQHLWFKNIKFTNSYYDEFNQRLKLVNRKIEIDRKIVINNKHFKVCLHKYKSDQIDKRIDNKLIMKNFEKYKNYHRYLIFINDSNSDKLFEDMIAIFIKMDYNFEVKFSKKTYLIKLYSDQIKFKVSLKKVDKQYVIHFKKIEGDRLTLHTIFEQFTHNINSS